jgi:hypothetical protein
MHADSNAVVGEYFADMLVDDMLLVDQTTVKAAARAWKSNVWSKACEPY